MTHVYSTLTLTHVLWCKIKPNKVLEFSSSHRGIRRIRNTIIIIIIIIIMLLLLLLLLLIAWLTLILTNKQKTNKKLHSHARGQTRGKHPLTLINGWQTTYLNRFCSRSSTKKDASRTAARQFTGSNWTSPAATKRQWRTAQQVTRDYYLWSVYRFLWWGVYG